MASDGRARAVGRTLFLHIGQPKTGTTHLQSLFTANRPRLAAAGVDYPVYGDDTLQIDYRRMVPCGNARRVLRGPGTFAHALETVGPADCVLFSSELMFNHICEGDGIDWLPDVARDHGFTHTRVLCLLRDPLSFAVSQWQQRVKGSEGETRTLEEYLVDGHDGPARAVRVAQRVEALAPHVSATWRRYETVLAEDGGLEGAVAAWLGLPATSFATRPGAVPNRSLSRSEAELQRQLNLRLGRSGQLFGFRVTVDVPEVAPDRIAATAPAAGEAARRLRPDVDALNAFLGPEDQLRLPEPGPDEDRADPSAYAFSAAQLAVLAAGVAEHLAADRDRPGPGTVAWQRARGAAGGVVRQVLRARRRARRRARQTSGRTR